MKRVGWLGNLALAALLVLDVAMVTLVVRHQRADPAVRRTAATVTSPTTSPTVTPSMTTATAPGPVLLPALLSVVDARTAWLADPGSCTGGGGTVSTTADAGATWTPAGSQPYRGLSRIDATSATSVFVVGADASCAVSVRSSSNGGRTWRAAGSVERTWAIDLKDVTTLHSTTGSTSTPCDTSGILALARTSDADATVLCDDGRTRRTTSSGATWSAGPRLARSTPPATLLGLTITGSGADSRVVAAVVQAGCVGVTVLTAPRTGTFSRVACIRVAPSSPARAAVTTEAGRPGTAWVLVGTTLWRSTGDLTAWSKAA